MKKEIWKNIPGYYGFYEVSNLGNVKRLHRIVIKSDGHLQTFNEKICSQSLTKKGYLTVRLTMGGFKKTASVHRLVAMAFISNTKNKPEVNHKDGNKANNFYKNLEWNTHKENINHAFKTGLHCTLGNKHPGKKITEKQVLVIRKNYSNGLKSVKQMMKQYGVAKSTIWAVIRKQNWAHI